MLVRGLMGCQSTAPSLLTVEQPSLSVKPLRAKRTQASPQPVRNHASKKPKAKSSTAQAGITAQSRKPKQKPAQLTSGENGLQQATPASPPASQSRKRKPSAAQPTTQAKSLKQTPKPAQITSGKDGLQAQAPVSQTRQPAPKAQTPKQKAVVSTSAVKKTTRSKTPVQTRTVRQSKVRGS